MAFTLQLKRHLTYGSKQDALNELENYLATTAAAGEPAIATYGEGQDIKHEKVLFGIKGAEKYTIFDADAIPSEVQKALDAAITAIKGGQDSEINDAYDTIKDIADALVVINGSGEGSIAKAKQDAKDYADTQITTAIQALDVTDTAAAKNFVTEVSEADGKIAVKRGAVTSNNKTIVLGDGADGGIDLKANVDGTTIVVDENTGVMSVASAALVQYVGQDAVKVSEASGSEKTISLAINENDKVLTQSADGLLANINLTWSSNNGLKLIGKGGTEIATIPAADFIKDGMLENVELKAASVEASVGGETEGTFLVFTFNTDGGLKVINLNVTSLIDVYTAGNGLQLDSKAFSVKLDAASEAFLSVGANGLKLSGVQTAIDSAVSTANTGLQGKIDTIEASVGLSADGTHVTTSGNYTSGASTIAGEIAALDEQAKTNADAIAAETNRATTEESRITNTVIGVDQLKEGKSVMDVILENEETTSKAINKLARAAGVLSGEEITYTAPTVSGEFSTTRSIMDMLKKIDEKWNTIDCGTY